METLLCPWEPATFWFISSNVPLLINYSHFIAIFSALAVSILVFAKSPRNILAQLFLFFASIFSIWAILDVLLWATNNPGVVMYAWSLQVLIEPFTYATAFFLFYLYLHKHLPPFRYQMVSALILLPIIIFLPTELNLEALQLSSCESIEGPIAKYYSYFANLLFTGMIVLVGFRNIPALEKNQKKAASLFLVGLVTFLLSFTSGNIISSFTDDWTISQYGLFGMPVFASLIAYSIVKFKTFNIQMAGAQILVIILWVLVCSLLFVDSELQQIITFITLVFATTAGYLLISSVKKEFVQRKEIESLAERLKKANRRLKELDQIKSEFVSIASHQLRSPLTSIRGYATMLLEGSYGKIPKKAHDALSRIAESSRFMALTVEDFLNVSRIEAGKMKYEYSDFNVKELAESVTDDMRQAALQRGLLIVFRSDCDTQCVVHADNGKVRQVLHNLIDNAMKYTPKGSITVVAHDDKKKKKVYISIKDTGVGMSAETRGAIFEKFVRAKNANRVNVTGAGLGLFVAKQMIEEMGGKITPKSEGEGKGSTFTIELPLVR